MASIFLQKFNKSENKDDVMSGTLGNKKKLTLEMEIRELIHNTYIKSMCKLKNSIFEDVESDVIGYECVYDQQRVEFGNNQPYFSSEPYMVNDRKYYADVIIPDDSSLSKMALMYMDKISNYFFLMNDEKPRYEFVVKCLSEYPFSRITKNALKLDHYCFQLVMVTVAEWRAVAKVSGNVSVGKFTDDFGLAAFAFFEALNYARMLLHTVYYEQLYDKVKLNDLMLIGYNSDMSFLFEVFEEDYETANTRIASYLNDLKTICVLNDCDGKDIYSDKLMICCCAFEYATHMVSTKMCLIVNGYAVFPYKCLAFLTNQTRDGVLGVYAKMYKTIAMKYLKARIDDVRYYTINNIKYETVDGLFSTYEKYYDYYNNKVNQELLRVSYSNMGLSTEGKAKSRMMSYLKGMNWVNVAGFEDLDLKSVKFDMFSAKFPMCINNILNRLKKYGDLKYPEKLVLVSYFSVIGTPFQFVCEMIEFYYKKKDNTGSRKTAMLGIYNRALNQNSTVRGFEFDNCYYKVKHKLCPFVEYSDSPNLLLNDWLKQYYGFGSEDIEDINNTLFSKKLLNRKGYYLEACVACSNRGCLRNQHEVQNANAISFYAHKSARYIDVAYEDSTSNSCESGSSGLNYNESSLDSVSASVKESKPRGHARSNRIEFVINKKINGKLFLPSMSYVKKKRESDNE